MVGEDFVQRAFFPRRQSTMNKIFTPHSKTPLEAIRDKFIKESKKSCLCVNTLNFVCWKVILLALFTLGSNACAIIPMPTFEQISATNDTKQTHSAILAAVHFKEWKVEDDSEGQIDVVRSEQIRVAAIRITYDEQFVGFCQFKSNWADFLPQVSNLNAAQSISYEFAYCPIFGQIHLTWQYLRIASGCIGCEGSEGKRLHLRLHSPSSRNKKVLTRNIISFYTNWEGGTPFKKWTSNPSVTRHVKKNLEFYVYRYIYLYRGGCKSEG